MFILLTSNPKNTKTGRIAKKQGDVLELKGRTSKDEIDEKYLAEGIMEDLFELRVMYLLYIYLKVL